MEYFLKASVVLALFYLCFYLILKKETFFQHNRWFLIFGIIIAMVFPLIVIPVEIMVEPVAIPEANFIINDSVSNTQIAKSVSQPFQWASLIPILYSIGLVVFLIQFMFQFGSLVLLLFKNPKSKDGTFTYVIVNSKISPFSFFKWIVYNPEAFEKNELKLMLTHEKIHAKHLHSMDILLAQLACVIFWFNPLIWLYRKEVRQNLEYIADFKTQKKSNTKKEYQHLLLKTSVANHNISLSNNFYNSSIKERIVMLKKSRSNRKKQWKYLLILPLLAGLLMSMNTEKVYVEAETKIENKTETLEFVVSKNTTDTELEIMTKAVAQKGGSLLFNKIKRNISNELTSIFVKLYDHSYGGGDSQTPIDTFIIYKELYGNGGGYVGRLRNGTMHFNKDMKDVSDKEIEDLKKRAARAIVKHNVQKISKTLNSDKINQSAVKIVFNKNMTDNQLQSIKKELKSNKIDMDIKRLKRNKKGEISSINIDFETDNSSANYKVKDEKGIKPFYFKMNENGSFEVGAVNDDEVIIVEEINVDDLKKPSKSKSNTKTYIYNNDENKVYFIDSTQAKLLNEQRNIVIDRIKEKIKTNDTIYYTSIDSAEIEKLSKIKSNIYYQSDKPGKIKNTGEHVIIHQPNKSNGNFYTYANNKTKPLVIVNGEMISYEKMQIINPDNIEKVHILKDKSAIEAYGKKGQNGVIVITLKGNNTWTAKADGEEKHLLKNKKQISSSGYTFIHDYDASKNASVAHISKITKDITLNNFKEKLNEIGVTVKYSKLKRNEAGEIVSIKIILKTENGKLSSASWKDDDGIPQIEFGIKEGSLIARTKQMP